MALFSTNRRIGERIPVNAAQPLVIWRLCDGKPGHENQTAGLVEALSRQVPVRCHDINVKGERSTADLPKPGLLVGAGHATHGAMSRLRRRFRARAVVLMKPTLGMRRFDLCVVPEHDGVRASAHVLLTRGVLNRVRAGPQAREARGLIAIGGPSRHHDWLGAEIEQQIETVLVRSPHITHWTITNSRRTPPESWSRLQRFASDTVACVNWQQTGPEWLASELVRNADVWVTEDSVSMLYEALSGGAAVGVLAVPRRRAGRVLRGLTALIADGLVTPFEFWVAGRQLTPPVPPLAEAERVADWIVEQWLSVA